MRSGPFGLAANVSPRLLSGWTWWMNGTNLHAECRKKKQKCQMSRAESRDGRRVSLFLFCNLKWHGFVGQLLKLRENSAEDMVF